MNRRGSAWLVSALLLTSALWPGTPLYAREARSPQEREAVFQEAMVTLERGDPRGSIALLRGLLAEDPGLVRVRLELARALFLSGNAADAREQFLVVLSGDPSVPPAVRNQVIAFIRQIDARSGFDWTLDISAGLHPEAFRRYDSDEIELDILGFPLTFRLSRPQAPTFAIFASGSASWRTPFQVEAGAGAATGFVRVRGSRIEAEGSDFDDLTAEGSLGVRWSGPRTTMEFGPFVRVEADGNASRERVPGARVGLETRSEEGLSVFVSLEGGVSSDTRQPDRDGPIGRARLGVQQSLRGIGDAGAAVFGSVRDGDAAWADTREIGAELCGSADVVGGWTLRGRAYALRYSEEEPLPALVDKRQERELGASLRVTKNDLFVSQRFTPYVEVSVARRDSDVAAFSFSSVGFLAGLSRAW